MKLIATLATMMVLLTAVGCASKKPADPMAANSVSDVTPTAPTAMAYTPEPLTTITPAQPTELAMTTTPQTGPAANGNSHVVKKGETLYSLAKKRYGDGKQWQKIASANPGVSPSTLKVGQTIVIP